MTLWHENIHTFSWKYVKLAVYFSQYSVVISVGSEKCGNAKLLQHSGVSLLFFIDHKAWSYSLELKGLNYQGQESIFISMSSGTYFLCFAASPLPLRPPTCLSRNAVETILSIVCWGLKFSKAGFTFYERKRSWAQTSFYLWVSRLSVLICWPPNCSIITMRGISRALTQMSRPVFKGFHT